MKNELNEKMQAIAKGYIEKNNLTIDEETFLELAYVAKLSNGAVIHCRETHRDRGRARRNHIYMQLQPEGGKSKRIPKNEW